MEILHSTINHARRDRDFGRVEAQVRLMVRYHPSLPPRSQTVLANVPDRERGSTLTLRDRVISEAATMMVLLDRLKRRDDKIAA